jgi:hypothetical protein
LSDHLFMCPPFFSRCVCKNTNRPGQEDMTMVILPAWQ